MIYSMQQATSWHKLIRSAYNTKPKESKNVVQRKTR